MAPAKGAAFNRGRSKQDYATPKEFIRAVEDRFGPIAVDLAASKENAQAATWISKEQDSLLDNWALRRGLLWLNPEFSDITPWAKKCAFESVRGANIALLVPAAVGSNWYADHVHNKALVLFLNPRLCFDGKNSYPKDCLLALYGQPPDARPWRWKLATAIPERLNPQ